MQLAVERRGEVIESALAEQVFCLEVDAQGRLLMPSARTFASGGDIHARVLPASEFDPDYRPGPVGPDMPANLVGSRQERQDQAEAYHARSAAVAEKARNLVGLEAEDAYLRWEQYDDGSQEAGRGRQGLDDYTRDLSAKFDPQKAGYPTRGRRAQRRAKGHAGSARRRPRPSSAAWPRWPTWSASRPAASTPSSTHPDLPTK